MSKHVELIQDGRSAYESGDNHRAAALLAQAIREGADYPDVHHTLGVVYHALGRLDDARGSFERALELNPNYTEAVLNLCITYSDLGWHDEARTLFERARTQSGARVDPTTKGKIANMHADVGDAYRAAGLPEEAVAEYRRALRLCPGYSDIRTKLAMALAESGRIDEGTAELRAVLDQQPDYTPAQLNLGLFLRRTGDVEGARNVFEQILEKDPRHERAALYLRMLDSKKP